VHAGQSTPPFGAGPLSDRAGRTAGRRPALPTIAG
jgi:hypothetical protein